MQKLFILFLAFTSACLALAAEVPADRVLVNGNILTVGPDDSVAEAIAIRDGLNAGIHAIGDRAID